jgi:MFS-type transporter involved in bile tolerance (Atg22 family)
MAEQTKKYEELGTRWAPIDIVMVLLSLVLTVTGAVLSVLLKDSVSQHPALSWGIVVIIVTSILVVVTRVGKYVRKRIESIHTNLCESIAPHIPDPVRRKFLAFLLSSLTACSFTYALERTFMDQILPKKENKEVAPPPDNSSKLKEEFLNEAKRFEEGAVRKKEINE